jgi:hypothetical protein
VSVAADLHGIEIPVNATGIRYTVTSSIDAESFGLTFVTDDAGLSSFLRSIERETSDLVVNANPWEVTLERTTSRYGWDLSKISNFAGLSVPRAEAGFDSYAVLVEYLDERVQVFLDAQQV